MVNLKAQQSALNNAIDEIYYVGFKSAIDGGLTTMLAKKASKEVEKQVLNYFNECTPAEARAYVAGACPVNRGWFNKLLRRISRKSESDSVKAARRGQLQVGNIYLRGLMSRINEDELRYRPLSDIVAKVNFGAYPSLGEELHLGQVYSKVGPVHTWGPIMNNLPEDARVFAIHYSKAKRHADEKLFGQAYNGIIVLRPSMGGSTLRELGARVDSNPDQGWEVFGTVLISHKNEVLYSSGELRDTTLFVVDKHGNTQSVPVAKSTSFIHSADILADWNFPLKFIEKTPKGMTKEETKHAIDGLCRYNAERV